MLTCYDSWQPISDAAQMHQITRVNDRRAFAYWTIESTVEPCTLSGSSGEWTSPATLTPPSNLPIASKISAQHFHSHSHSRSRSHFHSHSNTEGTICCLHFVLLATVRVIAIEDNWIETRLFRHLLLPPRSPTAHQRKLQTCSMRI